MTRRSLPFDSIESLEFSARLGIANSLSTFVDLLNEQDEFKQLMKQRCDPQMLAPLMDRVKDLLERRFDPAYRNPSDAALAAYLAILDCAGKDYSLPIIDQYAARRDLWWARRLASHLQPFAFSQKYVAESSAAKLGGEVPLRAFLVTDAGKVLSRGKTFPVNPRGEWIAKGPIFLDFALNHHGVKLQRANVPEFFVYGHLERKVS